MHEIVFRSHAGDPTVLSNVLTLCYRCHLRGLHKQSSPESEWFAIVIVNLVEGANDPHGVTFEPWILKRYRNGVS